MLGLQVHVTASGLSGAGNGTQGSVRAGEAHLSTDPPTYPPTRPPSHLPLQLPFQPLTFPPIPYPSTHPPTHLSVLPPSHPSVHPPRNGQTVGDSIGIKGTWTPSGASAFSRMLSHWPPPAMFLLPYPVLLPCPSGRILLCPVCEGVLMMSCSGQLRKSILSFCHVGPGHQTQVTLWGSSSTRC